jgi:hypothetical protein
MFIYHKQIRCRRPFPAHRPILAVEASHLPLVVPVRPSWRSVAPARLWLRLRRCPRQSTRSRPLERPSTRRSECSLLVSPWVARLRVVSWELGRRTPQPSLPRTTERGTMLHTAPRHPQLRAHILTPQVRRLVLRRRIPQCRPCRQLRQPRIP